MEMSRWSGMQLASKPYTSLSTDCSDGERCNVLGMGHGVVRSQDVWALDGQLFRSYQCPGAVSITLELKAWVPELLGQVVSMHL